MRIPPLLVGRTSVTAALCLLASGAVTTGAASATTSRQVTVTTTIQAAVDAAAPGDTVVVPAGTYREVVVVSTPGITIVGNRGAVLDGTGLAARVGIRVGPPGGVPTLQGFTLDGLTVRGYLFAGVQLRDVTGFRLTGGTFVDNEEYGVFPVRTSRGRVDHLTVRGSDDSGIYVGQSSDVVIDHNLVHANTTGIEVELSRDVTVSENVATDNALGLVVQVVPGRGAKVTDGVTIERNVLSGNNRANPNSDPDDILSLLPAGVGILNIGGDGVDVRANTIAGNRSAGIGVVRLPEPLAALDTAVNPVPDRVHVLANTITGNAFDPDARIAPFPPKDLVWDGTGTDNCFSVGPATSTFPDLMPACAWAAPAHRIR